MPIFLGGPMGPIHPVWANGPKALSQVMIEQHRGLATGWLAGWRHCAPLRNLGKSGNLEIWGPGNPDMWGPNNLKNENSQNPNPFCPKCWQGLDW